MKHLTLLLTLLIILSLFSCQMRGSNGKKANNLGNGFEIGGAGAGAGGTPMGGTTMNNITISDAESLRFACGLYEEQKKRDEWFNTHNIYESCGYEESTYNFNGEIIPTGGTSVECTNPSEQAYSTADQCDFFGDLNEVDKVELRISIKFNLTYKAIVIVQNGIIKIEPLYKWYEGNLVDDDKIGDYVAGLNALGAAYGYIGLPHIGGFNLGQFREKHMVGTIPGYCNEENTDRTNGNNTTPPPTNASANGPHAKVTVNGTEYNWHMVGFTPFRIPEYSNQYVFSGDCVGNNATTNADENTNIEFRGPIYNNFINPIHPIEVTNESVNLQNNTGCREVSVNFTLGYYKTKATEYEEFQYSNTQLEEMCKTNNLNTF